MRARSGSCDCSARRHGNRRHSTAWAPSASGTAGCGLPAPWRRPYRAAAAPKWSQSPKEDEMRRKLLLTAVLGALFLGAAAYVGKVQATPASRFSGTTLAVGRFEDIDVNSHQFPDDPARPGAKNLWLSLQKTKGLSDLYVQSNLWEVGGTTGWHTHPGHSLITVTAGTVTAYEGNDPTCTPHVYTVGMGFVDEGGDHVHVIRNEGSVDARTVAVQLIPAGATRRIDAPGNPACSF